jgi:tRNA1(Val) A37 N6-methylase TrmN6
MTTLTKDLFLGEQLKVTQPKMGYRAGSDAVFLASFVGKNPKKVLDVGCGVGVASLCLMSRLPSVHLTGIDCQDHLIHLARKNAEENGFLERSAFLLQDLHESALSPNSFDHVMSNPPYFDVSSPSPDDSRALARCQTDVGLDAWIKFCIKMARPRGYVSLICPASLLPKALHFMNPLGEIILFPLWSRESEPANRILIRGRKDIKSPAKLLPGLILHKPEGGYTEEAHKVLWEGLAVLEE